MDDEKLKNRINALFRVIVEGDLNLRMNYLARLLDHLDVFVERQAMGTKGDLSEEIRGTILDMEDARQNYENALEPWSRYLAGNPNGLSRATIFSDKAIQIITKIIENHNINTTNGWQFKHIAAIPEKPETPPPPDPLPSDIFRSDT